MENELWLTALLNRFLAGPADAVLNLVNMPNEAAHPWSNWMSMELLVAAIIVVVFAILRDAVVRGQPRQTPAHL